MLKSAKAENTTAPIALARWREWTELVRKFAERKPGRHSIRYEDYLIIHFELMTQIRAQAASEGPRQQAWREAVALASPWVSVESVGHADPEILLQLVERAQELGREIKTGSVGKPRWKPGRSTWFAVAIVMLLIFAFLLLTADPAEGDGVGVMMRRLLHRCTQAVANSSAEQRLIVAGGVVAVIAVGVVWLSAGRGQLF